MKAKTVKEALIATRNIIDQLEWCQGKLYQAKAGKDPWNSLNLNAENLVGCCLEGAISALEIKSLSEYQILREARALIRGAIGTSNISQWNDAPGRTKQQVLDMLDGVIAKLPS